jgi:tetratricopeptide (TPR) repeat protein
LAATVAVPAVGSGPAYAQQADETGCVASAVDNDLPDVGERCTAILNDANIGTGARAEALLVRGVWHYRAGRLDEAKQDFDAGLKLAPDDARLLQLRASIYLDEGEVAEAETMAKKSAEIDPNRASTFEILAGVAESRGDRRSQLAYLNRTVELGPEQVHARYNRARLLMDMSRAPEALADTTWLISRQPAANDRAGWAWINFQRVRMHIASLVTHGEVLQAMDRFEEAEAQFGNAVAYQRSSFTLTQRSIFLHGLPVGAGMRSRLEEAMKDAEEAVRLNPENARALKQYASTLEYAKRPADALAVIEKAIESEQFESALPALLWMRARNLRALQRHDEAVDTARASIELAKDTNRTFLMDRLARLTRLGYWQASGVEGAAWTSAIDDAVTACMADEACW